MCVRIQHVASLYSKYPLYKNDNFKNLKTEILIIVPFIHGMFLPQSEIQGSYMWVFTGQKLEALSICLLVSDLIIALLITYLLCLDRSILYLLCGETSILWSNDIFLSITTAIIVVHISFASKSIKMLCKT